MTSASQRGHIPVFHRQSQTLSRQPFRSRTSGNTIDAPESRIFWAGLRRSGGG